MHVIAKKPLILFWTKYPDSKGPLKAWYQTMDRATFKTWGELKKTFSTADKVGNKIVFNVGGNKYRLVTVIHFNRGKVFVRDVLTHKEYDKRRWQYG